jgi:hypothetical protein
VYSASDQRIDNERVGPAAQRVAGRKEYMRKLMFLAILGIFGAAGLKADPMCTTNTVAYYEANITSVATACSIGNLNFSLFNEGNAGTTSSGSTSSPFNASQIDITPVAGGIMISPLSTSGFQATATGVADLELPFQVTCADGTNCLTGVTMTINGSATAGTFGTAGVATLTETYCVGGVVLPPTGPCPVGSSGTVKQDILTIGPSGPDTVSKTDTFAGVSDIDMNKDLQALGNNGSAAITSVTDTFTTSGTPTPTPEPSSLLLLAAGVVGLAFLSKRRQSQAG